MRLRYDSAPFSLPDWQHYFKSHDYLTLAFAQRGYITFLLRPLIFQPSQKSIPSYKGNTNIIQHNKPHHISQIISLGFCNTGVVPDSFATFLLCLSLYHFLHDFPHTLLSSSLPNEVINYLSLALIPLPHDPLYVSLSRNTELLMWVYCIVFVTQQPQFLFALHPEKWIRDVVFWLDIVQ